MRRLLVLLALVVASLLPLVPATADVASEERLLALVNRDRAAAGLAPMTVREEVGGIAEFHSADMEQSGVLEHNDEYFTDRTRDRLDARALGENVAYGPTVEDVHRMLMASEGHRHNLLDPRFTVVGIGIVKGSDRLWVTEDFVQPE